MRPSRLQPWACAASSTSATPRRSHSARMASTSGVIIPPMCTSTTALVEGVSTASTVSAVSAKVEAADVGEHRPPAGVHHGGGGGVEGVRRHDHVVVGHADHAQRDLQRRGPGGHRHGVLRAVRRREGGLEPLGVGSERQGAGGQALGHGGGDRRPVVGAEHDASRGYCHCTPPKYG